MHIDKYKQPDGWYKYEECDYEHPWEVIHIGMWGFCGCANPEVNIQHVRDGLNHVDRMKRELWESPEWNTSPRKLIDKWHDDGSDIFGNDESEQFFYYWCDKMGYTEHGGCIPGWLTAEGLELLDDLNEIIESEEFKKELMG